MLPMSQKGHFCKSSWDTSVNAHTGPCACLQVTAPHTLSPSVWALCPPAAPSEMILGEVAGHARSSARHKSWVHVTQLVSEAGRSARFRRQSSGSEERGEDTVSHKPPFRNELTNDGT